MTAEDKLRILAGSDLHNSRTGFEWFCRFIEQDRPDLVIFLGDFITRQPLSFTREVLAALRTLATACLIVPGNWDPRETLAEIDSQAGAGLRNMHNARAEVGGYSFAGLGGSITTPLGSTPLESPENGFADRFAQLLPADVWVLHNPILDYRDMTSGRMHVGSVSLANLWRAQEEKPLLVLSGHIHEAVGYETAQGTLFVNPGSLGGRSAALVTLEGREAGCEILGGGGGD